MTGPRYTPPHPTAATLHLLVAARPRQVARNAGYAELWYDRWLARGLRDMDRLTIRIQKNHPGARLPEFAHGPREDAGMDLFSAEEVILPPGGWASVGTGLSIELPPGYDGQVRPRSGLARKYGVTLLNTPGTIDPGYRGEIRVLMINHGDQGYTIWPGDRIAQLVVGSYAAVDWEVAEQLAESERGDGGFGSTGE